jgi:hypothetical protein
LYCVGILRDNRKNVPPFEVTEFPQPPQQSKAFQLVYNANRLRQAIPFLDVLVIRKGMTMFTKVYGKATYTG